MSEFLKIPESAHTPTSLNNQLARYFLHNYDVEPKFLHWSNEETRKEEEEKYLKSVMNHMGRKSQMYGSAHELLENVKIFSNFPGNWDFFNLDFESYQTPPIIFYNLKNEKFICKSDVFVILQNIAKKIYEGCPLDLLLIPIAFLKSAEDERFEGERMEFVRFDEKVFEEIEKEIRIFINSGVLEPTQMKAFMDNIVTHDVDGVFAHFAQLVPAYFEEADNENIRFFKLLEIILRKIPKEKHRDCLATTATMSAKLIYAFEYLMKKRPEMFLPNSGGPITVRVFEDGDQRFVMNQEVWDAMGIREGSADSKHHCISTDSLENVQKLLEVVFAGEKKTIEFIRYPILRAKHKATPIPGPPLIGFGNLFVLAIDAFFELFRYITFAVKYFQSYQDPFPELQKFFSMFDPEYATTYFMRTENLIRYEAKMNEKIQMVEGVFKEVRSFDNGFTLEDLKAELKNFGLVRVCPEIQNHADVVYSEVVKKKKEEILRTCDLFDAIEHCLLICVLNRIRDLKIFVHKQKGCHRVYGYKCDYCTGSRKLPKTAIPEPIRPPPRYLMKKAMELSKDGSWAHIDMDTGRVWSEKDPNQKTSKKDSESEKTPEVNHQNREKNKKKKEKQKKAKLAKKMLEKDSEGVTMNSESQKILEDVKKDSDAKETPYSKSEYQKLSESPNSTLKTSKLAPESQEIPEDVTTLKKDSEDEKTPDLEFKNLETPESQKTSEVVPETEKIPEDVTASKKDSDDTEEESDLQKTSEDVTTLDSELKLQKTSEVAPESQETSESKNFIQKTSEISSDDMKTSSMIQKTSESNLKGSDERKIEENEVFKLKKLIAKLEEELAEEKQKTSKIQNQMTSEILEKNRKIQELEIQKATENEMNERMIQQLLDKLGGGGANYSNPSTSSRFN